MNDSWPVPGLGSSGLERNSEHVATPTASNRANSDGCGRRIAGHHSVRLCERSVWELSLARCRHPERIAMDCNESNQFLAFRFLPNTKDHLVLVVPSQSRRCCLHQVPATGLIKIERFLRKRG